MPLNTNTIWTPTRDVSVTALVEFGLGPLPLSRAVPTVGRYLSILIQFSFPGTIAELSLLLDSLDGFKADKFFPVNFSATMSHSIAFAICLTFGQNQDGGVGGHVLIFS